MGLLSRERAALVGVDVQEGFRGYDVFDGVAASCAKLVEGARILGVLATCYITALALRITINLSYKAFVETDWQAQTLFELFGGTLSTSYLLVCWSVLYFGIKFYESQRKQEEAMLKAVALAQEAQLKMLRYQLNPHFLFNTLNAISTLILDNQNRKANHAVTRLSEFLRYTLDQDPMKKVTLRQEIEALGYQRNFTIFDEGDALSTMRRLLADAALSQSPPPEVARSLKRRHGESRAAGS